jgi:hypothetical protein
VDETVPDQCNGFFILNGVEPSGYLPRGTHN